MLGGLGQLAEPTLAQWLRVSGRIDFRQARLHLKVTDGANGSDPSGRFRAKAKGILSEPGHGQIGLK